ncbi:MAG: hypothetical protein RLN63_03600 [Miltoncostaeaceae bacterium]
MATSMGRAVAGGGVGALVAVGAVLAGTAAAAPASVDAPSIAGKVRFNSTVLCRPGNWSGDPASFSYRWLLGGGPLFVGRNREEATGPRLRLNEPGVMNGNRLSCEVTATDAAGASTTARSADKEIAKAPVVVRLTKVTSLRKGRVRIQGIVRPLAALRPASPDNLVVVRRQIRRNTFEQLSLPARVNAKGRFSVLASTSAAGRRVILVDFSVAGNRSSLWSDAQVKRRVLFTRGGRGPFTVRVGT